MMYEVKICYGTYGKIRQDMLCYDVRYVKICMVGFKVCMLRYRRLYLLSESSLSYVYAVGKQPDSNV